MNKPDWLKNIKPYAVSNSSLALRFVATSFIPYILLVTLMFLLIQKGYPYWLVLLVALPTVGFYIRLFIILHDCSHGSFTTSKNVNTVLGYLCGILTFTPYHDWQHSHAIHHADVGNLDKRGVGDINVMTLKEYQKAGNWDKLKYRIYRNPFFLFLFAAPLLFLVLFRFPQHYTNKKGHQSILITNSALALIMVAVHFTVGLTTYVMVQLPVVILATAVGLWLFYIQHQFRNVYWAHQEEWDVHRANTEGASFYNLPPLLRWFTGSIGYHSLHHLNPHVPCYTLKKCYTGIAQLHKVEKLTLSSSLRSLFLHVWDEDSKKLLSFKEAALKRPE